MQQQTIGRYQVLEEIASGGQGTVYRAWDTGSGRVVALKVLHPHLASDLGVLERFRREAQLAAAVVHPNITTIYEVGQHGNNHFIAMEYLPDSIHNLIVSTGRLPIDRAVDICRQAAVGLEAASRRGIIHRDIKPQNLLLAPDGTVKVTDFGIARATALSTMTRTGALMGTPHYMSPEQAQGQRVDIRSDIYSLGIVLYQMLTGQLPFEANTPYEVIRQQVEQRPGPVRRLRSDIPGAVERIVNRCLEKNPERRYQSPGDLARALGEVVPGTGRERIRQQQRAPAAPASAPRPPEQPAQRRAERARPNTTRMQSWARAWQKTHRSRWAWFLPVIPILIALVVAAVRLDVVDVDSVANWVGAGGQPVVQNTPAPPVATPDNGITIPDVELRTAIAATLNIAAGEPITAADMAKLTEFDAPDSFISDLSGLEAAINLKEFNLRGNAIADLSPLASLVNIRALNLTGNTISDVSPLGGSPNIAYLYIAGNLISDVAPLAGLTQLRHLHISDNSISDVSPLAALPNLEELFLGMNSISDLAPLVGNSGLGAADEVEIDRNPLNVAAVNIFIPALEERGVNVVGAPSPTLALAGTEFEDFFNWTSGNIDPANVANRVVETFGQDWRLADWNDVKLAWELYYWDMKDVFDRTHYLLVSRDGAYQADPGSWYFIEDHNGSKPPSFHSWDELGNHQISLGSNDEGPWGVLAVRRDFADLATASGTAQPAPTLTAAAQPAPTVQPKTGTIISADLIGALPNDLLILGSAFHAPGEGVVLTPPSTEQHGFLFYKHPVNIEEFEAEFSFYIGQGTGADGLAFVVSSTLPTGRPVPNNVIGLSAGDQLHGFAVEFDTYRNVDTNLNIVQDATANHVDLTLYPEVTSLAETSNVPRLRNAGVFRVLVRFDRGQVRVYLENVGTGLEPTLVLDHDIPGFEPFEGYFGFYSATGALHDLHLIKDFELRISEDMPTGVPSSNHKRVGSGDAHTCSLRSDGTAVCWGNNEYNQASPPSGAFVHISSGDNHSCVLLRSGTIQCWGRNDHGQASPSAEEQFLTFDSSKWHNCGIRVDGTLRCWGSNIAGESLPPAGSFVAVSGGEWHTCGLRVGGIPVCWGINDHGQSSPPPGERFSSISSGFGNSCGIRFDGTAVCWGLNDVEQSDPPTGDQFLALAAGHGHTCGLRIDGTVVCWGNDKWGKLDSPTGTFTSIDSSPGHTCALTDSLDLECWGPGAPRDTSLRSDVS